MEDLLEESEELSDKDLKEVLEEETLEMSQTRDKFHREEET